MKNSFKKIINLFILVLIFANPILIFANEETLPDWSTSSNADAGLLPSLESLNQPVENLNFNTANNQINQYDPNSPFLTPNFVNSQIQNSISTTRATSTQAQTNSATQQGATGIASCLGSQIVAQAIVQSVNSFASNAAGKVTDSIINVPVAEGGSTGAAIKTETSARVGTGISLFGFSIPQMPSWDAMAYCIVNTMIIYIANSTIAWVNSGFEGNPAFLNNPEQFFVDLANQEKIAFLQGLAYGVNSSVCGVYKSSVLSALLSRYGRNQQNYNQQGYQRGGYGNSGQIPQNSCPFDNNSAQLNLFMRGDFIGGGGWNTWFQITQNPRGNPYDTYFNSMDRLERQVEYAQTNNERELNWNNGYLSFRTCENGETDKSKCPITTPGSIIESQLESTLNLGKNRLVLQEKFDQVVTAVIDQLITTALNRTLSTVNESLSGTGSSGGNSNSNNQNPWNSPNSRPYIDQNISTTTASTTGYRFTRDLKGSGSVQDIIELKKFFIAQGYLSPNTNLSGDWDGDLSNAVFSFQRRYGLGESITESGYVVGRTRNKINELQGF